MSNLGGTFPRIFVLKLVDFFTSATCLSPTAEQAKQLLGRAAAAAAEGAAAAALAKAETDQSASTKPFSCALASERDRCEKVLGRSCLIQRDGYYITNIVCVIVGVVTFWGFIRPAVLKLQALPLRAWRLGNGNR